MDVGVSDSFIQVRKMRNRERKQVGLRHQVVDTSANSVGG